HGTSRSAPEMAARAGLVSPGREGGSPGCCKTRPRSRAWPCLPSCSRAAPPGLVAWAGASMGDNIRPVRLADVPPVLRTAVLAIEDERFYEHGGLDPRGVLRAVWANVRKGRVVEGGSTITQQLVKSRLLTPERTFSRKLNEAFLSTAVEWRYSKDQILEAYLNEIYLGQAGGAAVRGVGAASRAYFGKEVHQLTLPEAALLAGMIRGPNSYSPNTNPD